MDKPLILIADDDKAIRVVLEKKLNRSGFNTKSTDKGKTLLSWVEQGEGDLIITDVVMEDSNGLDLLPLIHDLRPGIPVMIMSGLNTIKTAIEASTGGAYEYFANSISSCALISSRPARLVSSSGNLSETSGISKAWHNRLNLNISTEPITK